MGNLGRVIARPVKAALVATATLLSCLITAPAQANSPSPTPISPVTSTAPPPPDASTLQLPPPTYADTPLKIAPISDMAANSCATPTKNTTTDPAAESWHLERLNMTQAWQLATGKGIKIAVIDTGIDFGTDDYTPAARFSAQNVLPPPDAQAADAPLECGHGTAVAALIGAGHSAAASTDFQGIAPDAQVIGIRALHGAGAIEEVDGTIGAIRAAIDMQVDIINISQAGFTNRGEYADAIQAALDAGIVVVAAAGNTTAMAGNQIAYPAAYPGVIAVGMTNQADVTDPESFAMPGLVSVAAPGVSLTTLAPSSGGEQRFTVVSQGTSYAAPLVSGVVALLLEQAAREGITLTPEQVKTHLELTADPPPGPIPDPQLGHGIVNPVRALSKIYPEPGDGQATTAEPSPTTGQQPIQTNPWPIRLALVAAALAVATVVTGLGLKSALPAARRRGGRPADPAEQ